MMSAQSDAPAGSIIETLRADHQRAVEAVRRDGYVLIPDVLTARECDYYSGLQLALAKKSKTYIGGYLRESDIMEKEFGFSKLLDHPDTYPIAKALLGGFARIMSTEAIIRT